MGLFGGSSGINDSIVGIQNAINATSRDFNPYISGGKSAQQQLMAQLGLGGPAKAFDVTQLPGYQNALAQGLEAVNQGGAGAGMLMSGERLKSLQSTGQNIFGDYYNNYLDRITGMSGQGLNAASGLANMRMGGAQQIGALQQQKGAQKGAMMGDLLGLAGTVGGMMVGGPMGAAVGGGLGNMAFGGGAPAGGGGFGPMASGYQPASALSMMGF